MEKEIIKNNPNNILINTNFKGYFYYPAKNCMISSYHFGEINKNEIFNIKGKKYFYRMNEIDKNIKLIDNSKLIFFDIGAYEGHVSLMWNNEYPNANIYCFEPCKKTFEKLNINTLEFKNISSYNIAIAEENGIKMFNECNHIESSSFLPVKEEESKKWKIKEGEEIIKNTNSYEVETIRLDTFMINNRINKINFLKIDTQGYDLNVVKSLGNKIRKVKEIVLEVALINIYKNDESSFDNVMKYMKEYNFSLYKILPQSFDQELNLWFINNTFDDHLHLDLI